MKEFKVNPQVSAIPKGKLPKPKMTVQDAGRADAKGRRKKGGNGKRYYLKEIREARKGYGRLA